MYFLLVLLFGSVTFLSSNYSEMQFVYIVLSVNLFCDEHALHFLIETNFFMKLLCCLLIFEETLQIKVMQ